MSYFVDSNIFLRVLIKEDEKTFKECFLFLNLIRQNKIKAFTSPLVLAEIDWILERLYKLTKQEAIKKLESILRLKGLKIINKASIFLSIELYKRYNIKFIDALIASDPRIFRKEMIIISYDKDFDKLKIKRLEPKEVLRIKIGKK